MPTTLNIRNYSPPIYVYLARSDGVPDAAWNLPKATRRGLKARAAAAQDRLPVPSRVDPSPPAVAWSTPRLLLGVGLAAFGAYWAVHERRCRGTGSLSGAAHGVDHSVRASPDAQVLYANLHIGYGNAREPSVTRRGNVCDVDWAFDSQEIWIDNSIPGRPLTYADPDTLQRWTFSNASAAPGPPTGWRSPNPLPGRARPPTLGRRLASRALGTLHPARRVGPALMKAGTRTVRDGT